MRGCNEEKGKNEKEKKKKRKEKPMRRVSHLPENIQPLQAHLYFLSLWKSPFTMYAASLQTLILNSNTNSTLLSAYLSDNFLLPD